MGRRQRLRHIRRIGYDFLHHRREIPHHSSVLSHRRLQLLLQHSRHKRRESSSENNVLLWNSTGSSHSQASALYSKTNTEAPCRYCPPSTYVLELLFSPASGETSVCFVRTSTSSNPFVFSIEVVDLDDGMYEELGPDEGLFYRQRRAYGATQVLRSDPYGRFWLPAEQNVLLTGIQSTAAFIDTTGASNKPPTTTAANMGTGSSQPLMNGQQMNNDSNQSANEADMEEINNLI